MSDLGVSESEVSKRLRFAEKFPTEPELCAAVTQFRSWHRIVHEALVTKKKDAPKTLTPAQRLCKAISEFDAVALSEDEAEALMEAARRLIENLSFFEDRRAA